MESSIAKQPYDYTFEYNNAECIKTKTFLMPNSILIQYAQNTEVLHSIIFYI